MKDSMKTSIKASLAAIFFGILHGWSITNPWNGQSLWWLQLITMAWLVRKLCYQPQNTHNTDVPYKLRPLVTAALLFSLTWFISSLWWFYTAMQIYGGLAWPLAVLAVIALCSFLASYYVVASAIFIKFKSVNGDRSIHDATLFAALWLFAELARGTVMSGFPWGAVGYAHIDGPLVSAAPWIGVYGISALAAFIAALLVLIRSFRLKVLILLALCVIAYWMPTLQATPTMTPQSSASPSLSIRLLQGNIPQNEKFDAEAAFKLTLPWYYEQIRAAQKEGVDLVIAPETAVPLLPQHLPPGYLSTLVGAFTSVNGEKQNKSAALLGIPLDSKSGGGYTNSVVAINSTTLTAPYRYDKHHLTPFGEFAPPLLRWFVDMMNIPFGEFKRGALNQPSFNHADQRFAINICYEELFGEELAARFANIATAPTVFVNVSNMAWFAAPNTDGMAIDQHLNISRMRAIEFDRPVFRATNTGATAVINHQGVVVHSLARSTQGVLNAELSGDMLGRTSMTPYASWASSYGLKPLWVLACGLILFAIFRRKYRSK